MRLTLFIVGGVLILIGIVWLLQGLNVLAGSMMSGSRFWGTVGAVCVLAGIGLEVIGIRRKKK